MAAAGLATSRNSNLECSDIPPRANTADFCYTATPSFRALRRIAASSSPLTDTGRLSDLLLCRSLVIVLVSGS